MPGRRLDLATDQLVLPESSDQLFPVPRGKHCRHSPVPGSACMACLQTATCCTQLRLCSLGAISTGHASNASIGFDALLKLLVDLNHRIADLVDLIALPRDGQQHLPAPGSGLPRPASTAPLLRQGMRHHRPDRAPPITGRRHVRRGGDNSSHSLARASKRRRRLAGRKPGAAKALGRKPLLRKASGRRESNPHHQLGRHGRSQVTPNLA